MRWISKLARPIRRGGTTKYQYDAFGNETSVTDPMGITTTSAYDHLNRLSSVTRANPGTGALPSVTSYVYDANGNVIQQWQQNLSDGSGGATTANAQTQYAYDALNRQIAVTTPSYNSTTLYTYDVAGDMTSLTDPDQNTTSYVYNTLGQVTSDTNSLGKTESFVYDPNGNLTTKTDRNGNVITYAYDGLNQPTSEAWKAVGQTTSTPEFSYTYDAAGNLTSAASPSATDYYSSFDQAGQAQTEVQSIGGLSQLATLTRQYDALGRTTQVGIGLGGTLTSSDAAHHTTSGATADMVNSYQYNVAGRQLSITQAGVSGGNAVAAKHVDLNYNADGQVTTINRYVGSTSAAANLAVTSSYGYDAVGRLTSLTHTAYATPGNTSTAQTVANYSFTYDAGDRMLSFTNTVHPAENTNYTYDLSGQLTGASVQGTQTLTGYYDANGNRLATGVYSSQVHNNELPTDGTYTYLYDANGNRTAKFKNTAHATDSNLNTILAAGDTDVTLYTYDVRNRLTKVQTEDTYGGAVTSEVDMFYDAFDRLVGEDTYGTAAAVAGHVATQQRFVYDGTQIAEAFTNGSLTNRYLWGPDPNQLLSDEQVTSTSSPGNLLWEVGDWENTIRDIVGQSTTGSTTTWGVVDHLTYNAFGLPLAEQFATTPVSHLFGYTGELYEATIGLQYNLERWYDPNTGNWTSQDPLGFGGFDPNLYRMAGNGPTNADDPTGLCWGVVSGAVVGGIVGGGSSVIWSFAFTGQLPSAGQFYGAIVNGAVAGGLMAGVATGDPATLALAGAAYGGLGGMAGSAVQQAIDNGQINAGQVVFSGAVGAVTGALGASVGGPPSQAAALAPAGRGAAVAAQQAAGQAEAQGIKQGVAAGLTQTLTPPVAKVVRDVASYVTQSTGGPPTPSGSTGGSSDESTETSKAAPPVTPPASCPVSPKTGAPIPTPATTPISPQVLADANTALGAIRSGGPQPFKGKWGQTHKNLEGNLPKTDACGNNIHYHEYYLPKDPGDPTSWGGNRLVIGTDGSVYATTNHYGQNSPAPPFVYIGQK